MITPDSASLKAEMESLRDFIIANVTQLQRRVSILERRVDDASSAGPRVGEDANSSASEDADARPSTSASSLDRPPDAPSTSSLQQMHPQHRRASPPIKTVMSTRSGAKGKEIAARSGKRSMTSDGRKVGECQSVAMETEGGDSPVERRINIASIVKDCDNRR